MRPLQTQQDWAAANIPGRSGYGADPTHGLLAALIQGAAKTQDDELLAMLLPALLQSMQPEDTWARDLERERFELDRDATLIDAYNIARETGDPRADSIWGSVAEGRGFKEPSGGGLEAARTQALRQTYANKAGQEHLKPEDLAFYQYMAGADDETASQYYGMEPTWTDRYKSASPYWGGEIKWYDPLLLGPNLGALLRMPSKEKYRENQIRKEVGF